MDKNTVTSSPVAAATEAIIAAICSFSRVPETHMIWIFCAMMSSLLLKRITVVMQEI